MGSCTWLLLDPLQTLAPAHDVSSNRPKIILQQIDRPNGKISKLHDWTHFRKEQLLLL